MNKNRLQKNVNCENFWFFWTKRCYLHAENIFFLLGSKKKPLPDYSSLMFKYDYRVFSRIFPQLENCPLCFRSVNVCILKAVQSKSVKRYSSLERSLGYFYDQVDTQILTFLLWLLQVFEVSLSFFHLWFPCRDKSRRFHHSRQQIQSSCRKINSL